MEAACTMVSCTISETFSREKYVRRLQGKDAGKNQGAFIKAWVRCPQ